MRSEERKLCHFIYTVIGILSEPCLLLFLYDLPKLGTLHIILKNCISDRWNEKSESERWSGRDGLTGPLLGCVTGWVVAVCPQWQCPLLPSRVTRLVRMPGLLAVVAELGTAAFPATHKPGAAGTAGRDDGKPNRRDESRSGELSDKLQYSANYLKQVFTIFLGEDQMSRMTRLFYSSGLEGHLAGT